MTATFLELATQYRAACEGEAGSVGDLGMALSTTPIITRDDAVAALDLVTDSDTNFDPATTVLVLEKLRAYIEARLPDGLIAPAS